MEKVVVAGFHVENLWFLPLWIFLGMANIFVLNAEVLAIQLVKASMKLIEVHRN